MRTFVSWRFWLTLAALAGLTFGLLQLTKDEEAAAVPGDGVATATTPPDAVDPGPPVREIDLIAPVFLVQADPGAQLVDGVTTAAIQVRVDGFRYMEIVAGTPGENRCADLDELASCVVAADLLGEAVLWFSFLPAGPRNTAVLPPIVELLEGAQARLANGWIVHRADEVDRDCDDDTTSLSDFVRRFGPGSVTTYGIDAQAVVAVVCEGNATTTAPRATFPPTAR